MTYKTDSGGFAFKCNDIKITAATSTWGTKLSQLAKQKGIVRIITYSLPDLAYVRSQFERRPHDIFLIVHGQFHTRAQQIKRLFPSIQIAAHGKVHSKVLLIEPNTVYISSANFGDSDWHETSIGLHSKEAHDWYVANQFEPLWDSCQEVHPYMTREEASRLLDTIHKSYPPEITDCIVHFGGDEWIVCFRNTHLYSPDAWVRHQQLLKELERMRGE